jgi:hypothetical protein
VGQNLTVYLTGYGGTPISYQAYLNGVLSGSEVLFPITGTPTATIEYGPVTAAEIGTLTLSYEVTFSSGYKSTSNLLTINVTANYYTVTFTETGLVSSGITWSVTLNGATQSATTTSSGPSSISFLNVIGGQNYTFTIGAETGYTVNPSSGSITVPA